MRKHVKTATLLVIAYGRATRDRLAKGDCFAGVWPRRTRETGTQRCELGLLKKPLAPLPGNQGGPLSRKAPIRPFPVTDGRFVPLPLAFLAETKNLIAGGWLAGMVVRSAVPHGIRCSCPADGGRRRHSSQPHRSRQREPREEADSLRYSD